jgi:3',5'-cyclic-AMP phosphodiesterase
MLLAQVSDTHLLGDASASVWGQNPASNLASLLKALPPVDAIAVTGDIADTGTIEAYRLADELTRRRAPRRYFIPGNHDNRAAMAAVFGEVEDLRLVVLSERWVLALVNSQWVGREAGRIDAGTLGRLESDLGRIDAHVVLCLHHPPLSPCAQPECTLIDSDPLLGVLRGGPVRVVLSGHLHQHFEASDNGIAFLGAPSTLNQLCHGGNPHYTDTGEPPSARLLELHDDGGVDHRIVTSET